MQGNFSYFRCRLLTFFKLTFSKNSSRNTIRVSNTLDPDQDRHTVGPVLGLNCLQRLSAEDNSCQYEPVFDPRVCDTESTIITIIF